MEFKTENTVALVHFFLHGDVSNDVVERLFEDEEFVFRGPDEVELLDITNDGVEYWKDTRFGEMIYVLHPGSNKDPIVTGFLDAFCPIKCRVQKFTDDEDDFSEEWYGWRSKHFG
jgi:hypothetical protein